MRVLIVEDERKVARSLREGLEAEHYCVRVAIAVAATLTPNPADAG